MASAKLYRDNSFLGGFITVDADVANLKNLNFNDVVSSIEVESGTFTIYEDVDFGGWSITVSAVGGPNSDGLYPGPNTFGNRNDAISSVQLNSNAPES